MADALLREEQREQGEPVRVPISDGVKVRRKGQTPTGFAIPADMARAPAFLDEVVEALCEYARRPGDESDLVTGFGHYLSRRGIEATSIASTFWKHNLKLMTRLVRENRDTIWGFILRNAYRPIYLSDRRFDFVVGNPPWLSYRYIQDQRYQDQIKSLVFAYGLLGRTETKLFTQMDTSTVFYEFCHGRYVKAGGTLAFVMPRTILSGTKQHERFRHLGFSRIVDLADVSPLFKVRACVLVRRGKARRRADIPVLAISGSLPARNLTWQEARPRLRSAHTSYTPPEGAGKARILDT